MPVSMADPIGDNAPESNAGRVVPIAPAKLPAPPVPSDADVTWADSMPLDVRRLRDSGIAAASSEVFHAAVLLWCAAWHQIPAASLPDDDVQLCALAGLGRNDGATWARLRPEALRGFVKCRDGRLYHPVVAEKALEVISRRKKQSDAGARGAMARWKAKSDQPDTCDGNGTAIASLSDGNATAMRFDGMDRRGEERKGEDELLSPPDGGVPTAKLTSEGKQTCPPCPHQAILDAYHELLPSNPRIREWHDKRASALRARWRGRFLKGKFTTQEDGVKWFRGYFTHVAKSRFLTGQAPASNGRPAFVADLEWLINESNFAKVIEGAYHDA